jgi:hypothetical protein
MRLALIAFVLFSLGGCGVKTVQLRKLENIVEKDPEKIEVFYDKKPTQEYDEIALLHADSGNFEKILNGFRRRASQLGGDALIVDKIKYREDKSFIWGTSETLPASDARVIIWKK